MKKHVILVAGFMRSGKDTLADTLINNSKDNFTGKISLAEPIKTLIAGVEKILGITIGKHRRLLQWVGTQWGRAYDEDIWLSILLKTIINSSYTTVVVPDVRFESEWQIHNDNFTVTRVLLECKRSLREARGADLSTSSHESEQLPFIIKKSMKNFGYLYSPHIVLCNNNSILDFQKKVLEIF